MFILPICPGFPEIPLILSSWVIHIGRLSAGSSGKMWFGGIAPSMGTWHSFAVYDGDQGCQIYRVPFDIMIVISTYNDPAGSQRHCMSPSHFPSCRFRFYGESTMVNSPHYVLVTGVGGGGCEQIQKRSAWLRLAQQSMGDMSPL